MKFIFLALILVVALAASIALVRHRKELVTHKTESTLVRFNVKDFPEHGVSLIVPSNPSFDNLQAKVPMPESNDSYSVILKNTGNRSVVGYAIKWECFDAKGEASDRDLSKDRNLSHLVSWVFLHGKESERIAAMNGSSEIIRPHSIWLISFDGPARRLDGGSGATDFGATRQGEGGGAETLRTCSSVTVTADGIFFDDGTFIGPDTTGFFTGVKSQMDAQYEILQGVLGELKSGKEAGEIFRGLERIRDREAVQLEESPTPEEFRSYFRNIFARDLLGKKEAWGTDKTIEDVQRQLSRPWVYLRKL